jgi:hypothetical protein
LHIISSLPLASSLASQLFNTTSTTSTKIIQPCSTTTPAIAVAPAAQHSRRPAAQHEPTIIRTNEICRLWTYDRLTTSPTDDRQHRRRPTTFRISTPRQPTRNETLSRRSSNRCPPRAADRDTRYRTSSLDTGLGHSILDFNTRILGFDTRYWTSTPLSHILDSGLQHPSWHSSGGERSSDPECA